MGVVEADDFVMLNEVDAVRLQAPQRFLELPCRFLLRSPVDVRPLCGQEREFCTRCLSCGGPQTDRAPEGVEVSHDALV